MSIQYIGVLISADTPEGRVRILREFVAECVRREVHDAQHMDYITRALTTTVNQDDYNHDTPAVIVLKLCNTLPQIEYAGWNYSVPYNATNFRSTMRGWYTNDEVLRWCLWGPDDLEGLFEYLRNIGYQTGQPKPVSRATFYGVHPVKSKRKIIVAPLP